jgi:hypothetical protein
MSNCIKCDKPIIETKPKGRNKSYCSVACRRSAELEIRRINDRLVSLEKIAQGLRLRDLLLSQFHTIEDIQTEINLQENRLKLLLAGSDS